MLLGGEARENTKTSNLCYEAQVQLSLSTDCRSGLMLTSERTSSNCPSEQNLSHTDQTAGAQASVLLGTRPCLASLFVLFVLLHSLLPLGSAVQIGADEGFEL